MKFSSILCILIFFTLSLKAQSPKEDSIYVRENYDKIEKYIMMRDGAKLFTSIYTPKDKSKKYPILLNRTPYTCSPYGENKYKTSLGNFPAEMREGFIFVYQDVRGRWMSEGTFEDVRPISTSKKGTDESTDTYDTIDWLLKNIENNNGNVGLFGISYPGFYSTAGLVNSHPALKAVSPQAPVTNWFLGDDFHHNGVFFLWDAFSFMTFFGYPRPEPVTPEKWKRKFKFPIEDKYQFFLEAGTSKELKEKYLGDTIKFINDVFTHPNYDEFWKERNILPHLTNVKPAVMVVGGFFDAEDAYGTFETYKAIEKQNPKNNTILVAGPWFHGGWVRSDGSYFGDIQFDQTTSLTYQEKYELPFFNYYLKNKGEFKPSEANVFISGSNEWKEFQQWPPKNTTKTKLYLNENGSITLSQPTSKSSFDEYLSDPAKPVPSQEAVSAKRTREYMIDDQRFTAKRPDVLVYETEVLDKDITLAGEILNHLVVSTTGTDADFVVKLIDVYPENAPDYHEKIMGGYQMLVRGEIMRASFRNGFEKAEALTANEVTNVDFTMPDIAHTFKKGHKIMIQIQSTWFPLADRNPQKFMNVYQATSADLQKANHRIYHDKSHASYVEVDVLD